MTASTTLAVTLVGAAALLLGLPARRITAARPRTLRPIAPSPSPPRRWSLPGGLFGRPRPVIDGDVATWCDDAARRLRAGDSLARAVLDASASPALARHLVPMRLAVERGASVSEAVLRIHEATAGLGLALGVVRACAALGGPAAEPLDRAAATLRARVADAAERRAQSAQPRVSATVLTVLPVCVLGALVLIADPIRAAVTTPAGIFCALTGSALNVAGWRWMRRIIEGTAT
jgi:Flp pilus assembly protein TadB